MTATRPATRPDARPSAVGLPRCTHSASIQLRAAAAAATCVAVKAEPANRPAARALPPLKPNQPNQSRPAPDQRQHHAVGVHGMLGIADALAQHQDGRQTGDARRDVDHRAAREVERAHRAEPADRRSPSALTAQTQWASGS